MVQWYWACLRRPSRLVQILLEAKRFCLVVTWLSSILEKPPLRMALKNARHYTSLIKSAHFQQVLNHRKGMSWHHYGVQVAFKSKLDKKLLHIRNKQLMINFLFEHTFLITNFCQQTKGMLNNC